MLQQIIDMCNTYGELVADEQLYTESIQTLDNIISDIFDIYDYFHSNT